MVVGREDFKEVVYKAWNTHCQDTRNIDRWQFKVRTFRRLVRGWATNVVAELNKQKSSLVEEYNRLDM
jgi:hypothetical protein